MSQTTGSHLENAFARRLDTFDTDVLVNIGSTFEVTRSSGAVTMGALTASTGTFSSAPVATLGALSIGYATLAGNGGGGSSITLTSGSSINVSTYMHIEHNGNDYWIPCIQTNPSSTP